MTRVSQPLLQEYLFKTALHEHNIDRPFTCDHQKGTVRINSTDFAIKFPKYYLTELAALTHDKIYNYCFIGSMDKELGREELLTQFGGPNSKIQHSRYGRNPTTKYTFKLDYYQTIANSWFSLCPVHVGEWYLHEYAWTYRFIESCFCKTIPIVFKKTPLGENFVKDIKFYWDDQSHTHDDYRAIVEHNYELAVNYWTITNEDLLKL